MNRVFVFSLLLPISIGLYAQNLRIETVRWRTHDLSARIHPRLDLNKDTCALLKVITPEDSLSFQGNIIGDVTYQKGVYWIYLSHGTQFVQFQSAQSSPLFVQFEDYDIKGLQGGYAYEMLLQDEEASHENQCNECK